MSLDPKLEAVTTKTVVHLVQLLELSFKANQDPMLKKSNGMHNSVDSFAIYRHRWPIN